MPQSFQITVSMSLHLNLGISLLCSTTLTSSIGFNYLNMVVFFSCVGFVSKIHRGPSSKIKHGDFHFNDVYGTEHVVPLHYFESDELSFEDNETCYVSGHAIFKATQAIQLIPIQKCTLQKSDDEDSPKNDGLPWCDLIMSAPIVVNQPAGYIAPGSTEVNFTGSMELYDPGFNHDKSKGRLTAKLPFVYDSINRLFTGTHEYLAIKSNQSPVGKVLELTFLYCTEQEKEPAYSCILRMAFAPFQNTKVLNTAAVGNPTSHTLNQHQGRPPLPGSIAPSVSQSSASKSKNFNDVVKSAPPLTSVTKSLSKPATIKIPFKLEAETVDTTTQLDNLDPLPVVTEDTSSLTSFPPKASGKKRARNSKN